MIDQSLNGMKSNKIEMILYEIIQLLNGIKLNIIYRAFCVPHLGSHQFMRCGVKKYGCDRVCSAEF